MSRLGTIDESLSGTTPTNGHEQVLTGAPPTSSPSAGSGTGGAGATLTVRGHSPTKAAMFVSSHSRTHTDSPRMCPQTTMMPWAVLAALQQKLIQWLWSLLAPTPCLWSQLRPLSRQPQMRSQGLPIAASRARAWRSPCTLLTPRTTSPAQPSKPKPQLRLGVSTTSVPCPPLATSGLAWQWRDASEPRPG